MSSLLEKIKWLFLACVIFTSFITVDTVRAAEHWQSSKSIFAFSANHLYLDIQMEGNGDFKGLYNVYTCSRSTPVSRTAGMSMYPCYVVGDPKVSVKGHLDSNNKQGNIKLENICNNSERPFKVIEEKNRTLTIKIDLAGCNISYQTLYSTIRKP